MKKTDLKHMIDEAGALDTQIKAAKKVLDPLKEALTDVFTTDGETPLSGDDYTVGFSVTEAYAPINVSALFDVLKKYGLEGKLFDVVKVEMGSLREILPPAEIEKLQGESIGDKISLRFKPIK